MNKALKGIKILDISRILAGPYCTQVLSDLGASVTKVESLSGDDTRKLGPPFIGSESAYFLSTNRGKKSVCVNLKDGRGQKIVQHLAAEADVVVENFKTGDLARYGLDYGNIVATNPGVVYASITGYGQTGARAKEPAVDTTLQGMTGLMSITGERDGPPVKAGLAVIDMLTGQLAVIGILSALRERDVSGKGQHIDLSLFDVGLMSMTNVAQNYLATGETPLKFGSEHPQIVPFQAFQAKDAGWFMLAAVNDDQFRRLGEVCNSPRLQSDPRYVTNADRMANKPELIELLKSIFVSQERSYWLHKITEAGISIAPINTVEEALGDPQAVFRGVEWHLEHPTIGDLPVMANALQHMSRTPAQPQGPPPLLGEHTREVLQEFMSSEEIETLVLDGVVALGS